MSCHRPAVGAPGADVPHGFQGRRVLPAGTEKIRFSVPPQAGQEVGAGSSIPWRTSDRVWQVSQEYS
jgi:hypothetical protein